MKSLEKGQDKIQKICDQLRNKTIEPAKKEAAEIIDEAKNRAELIKAEAENHAEQIISHARAQIEQERNVFQSSLKQASKQVIETLKQEIEHKFFNDQLQEILDKQLSESNMIANLINGLVTALEKEGVSTDLSAVIAKNVSVDEVNQLLLEKVRKRLKEKPFEIGSFKGGAQVKLLGKKMTLDLSDQALKELVANYVRKDFRHLIFS
jgi:V/A-type H+/Na+-transporting ATPase subunit E